MAKMPVAQQSQPSATIVVKKGLPDPKTETIIANPKSPADDEVPTNFVPLGAIITNGDEINFHLKSPTKNKKTRKQSYILQEMIGNPEAEKAEAEGTNAARMKELRLLSKGKKLLDCCKAGNAAEAEQLMLDGAPFIADWVGTSPLHYAVINKHVQIAELLLKAGICIDAKNKVSRTPLHIAAQMGLSYMVKLLLSYGADVNCKDMLDMTPLHWGAESGELLTTKILLDYGADTKAFNKFGKLPIDLANRNKFSEVSREILGTEKLHPEVRMTIANNLTQKLLGHKTGINPVAEILEPNPSNFKKLTASTSVKKVVLVAKENPEGGAYRGTLQISSDIESDEDKKTSNDVDGEMSADSALKLLKSHGVSMVEPDKDTVISSAVLNGHTIRLTDAGKLAFKSLEKNLKIDSMTANEQDEPQVGSTPDSASSDLEGPPAKMPKLLNGQKMTRISAQQLMDMKNENKIIIKGASPSESAKLPDCVIDIPKPPLNNSNQTSADPDGVDPSNKNQIYLQRLENKANLILTQLNALKKQLKIKEEEYSSIRKQIQMFKSCTNQT